MGFTDRPALPRRIVGFHTDAEGHWVADLECGHGQHVRHEPPLVRRPWVLSAEGRASMLGAVLQCTRCAEPPAWTLRRLHALDDVQIEALAEVLIDCVEGGASVSFMHPLTRSRAVPFWRQVARDVSSGARALLVAEDAQGICGTVQLVLDQPENQPHRADLSKMLVHRRVRRQGLGSALMRAAEVTGRACGKTLLVLDAVTDGDAARLYERLGWVRVGVIPDYALFPGGGFCDTTIYYRILLPTPELQ